MIEGVPPEKLPPASNDSDLSVGSWPNFRMIGGKLFKTGLIKRSPILWTWPDEPEFWEQYLKPPNLNF
jgi:hypothetical protein